MLRGSRQVSLDSQSKAELYKYSLFHRLRLDFTSALDITAMISSDGEKIQLSQNISTAAARGAVEKWLLQVQDVMIVSVRDVIEQAKDVRALVSSPDVHS